jgi:hypothetical protein
MQYRSIEPLLVEPISWIGIAAYNFARVGSPWEGGHLPFKTLAAQEYR